MSEKKIEKLLEKILFVSFQWAFVRLKTFAKKGHLDAIDSVRKSSKSELSTQLLSRFEHFGHVYPTFMEVSTLRPPCTFGPLASTLCLPYAHPRRLPYVYPRPTETQKPIKTNVLEILDMSTLRFWQCLP